MTGRITEVFTDPLGSSADRYVVDLGTGKVRHAYAYEIADNERKERETDRLLALGREAERAAKKSTIGDYYPAGFSEGPTEYERELENENERLWEKNDALIVAGWRACVLGMSRVRFWQAEAQRFAGDLRSATASMEEATALRDWAETSQVKP